MIRRIVRGVAYALVGGLGGATSGLVMGLIVRDPKDEPIDVTPLTPEQAKEDLRDHLVRHVRMFAGIRKAVDAGMQIMTDGEYKARRQLEALGYYPCSSCGVPHLDGGGLDCLPDGAYFSEALRRYIEPGHPDWSPEEYQAVTGVEWTPATAADEDDDPRH